MEKLANKNVQKLIARAVDVGNTKLSMRQLITLATALGDQESLTFLKSADFKQIVAVKNYTAQYVFGKAPEQISTGIGTFFGQSGEKESTVAINALVAGRPEKGEPVDEKQKDIRERRKVEDRHPDTSDHKSNTPAVSDPLKEKTDAPIKEVLDRGPKNQEKLEKSDDRKRVAASKDTVSCDIPGKESPVHAEQEALMKQTGEHGHTRSATIHWTYKTAGTDTYADLGIGDVIQVQTEMGATNVKIDMVGSDNQGKPTLIGKDDTNKVRVVPTGTQVQTVTSPSQLQTSQQMNQTQMMPAAPAVIS